jgi:hypothetical protein
MDLYEWKEKNRCPVCDDYAVTSCRCPRCDSFCANGHHWHWCTIHHVKVLGGSDHSLPTLTCTCGGESNGSSKIAEQDQTRRAREACDLSGMQGLYEMPTRPEISD